MTAADYWFARAEIGAAVPATEELVRPKVLTLSTAGFAEGAAVAQFVDLLEQVCNALFVSPEDVLGRSRSGNVAQARHVVVWAARKRWGLSYPELGRLFSRDHSTMMAAVARIEGELAKGGRLADLALRHSRPALTFVPGQGIELDEETPSR
jgi:chromosomal replication initiation ATPase DnaA